MLFLKQKQSPHSSFKIPAHVSENVCYECLYGIAGGLRGHSGMAVSDTAITGGAATQGAADTLTGCAFSRPDDAAQQNTVKSCVRVDNPFRSADNATDRIPPAYNLQRSVQLLQQLMVLFPDNPRVQEMVDNWQKSARSRALPEEAMTGWNEGMTRLQLLAERLNRPDEQRGKYMTVSELKTEVSGIM